MVKKLGTNLTSREELSAAECLNNSTQAVEILKAYLQKEVIAIDKVLGDTNKLYSSEGAHLRVASLLAQRETQMKLLNLLTEKIDIT